MKPLRLSKEIDLLFAGIGASQALYLAINSLSDRHRNRHNLILGLFFLAITIRIVKSLLWVYWTATPNWFINLGFAAHALAGPLLLLYLNQFIFQRRWSHWNWLHCLPAGLGLLLLFELNLSNFWYLGGYTALLYHQVIYGFIALGILLVGFRKKRKAFKPAEWIWLFGLVLGLLLLQLSYFSNYILQLTPYLLGPVIYAIFVYVLSLWVYRHPQVFQQKKPVKKYHNINLSDTETKQHLLQLQRLLEQEKLYLQHDCTIQSVAKQLQLPPYLLSHLINKTQGQNFPDYINGFRIIAAQQLLKNPKQEYQKISGIAYDCGFRSLSSFNKSFKKYTGMTPSAYRNGTKRN